MTITCQVTSGAAPATSNHDTPPLQEDFNGWPAQTGLQFLAGKDCLAAQDSSPQSIISHLTAFPPQQSAEPLAIKLCYTGS
ncbi:TPA: hypothetical protein ACH3X3_000092 [Trebouxia sp. C0006]